MSEEFEEWRELKITNGKYSVSSIGNVRRNDWIGFGGNHRTGYILKPWIDSAGYKIVSICFGNRDSVVKFRVYRLVVMEFYENYDGKLCVDHIDHDRLNDSIQNLRMCTQSNNMMNIGLRKNNTSGYKGVNMIKHTGKWYAYINKSGKRYGLGSSFRTASEAAMAYDKKAREMFGEYGRYNFPQEGERGVN